MAASVLEVIIAGDPTPLSGALTKATADVKKFATASGAAGTTMQTALVAGAAVAGVAVVAGVTKAINITQSWAAEVRTLQRVTGESGEATSKLAAAGEILGLSTTKLNTGFGLLDKNIVNNSANLLKYGIELRDAHGEILPFSEVLGNVSDKFQTLQPGAEQAAFAMNVFGRSGKEMIPILQRGSEGLKELGDQAEAAGVVMSDADLQASKDLSIAQRQLGEAFKGIAVRVGKEFIPAMTELTGAFVEFAVKVGPIVADVLTPVADALSVTAEGVSELLGLLPGVGTDSADAADNLKVFNDELNRIARGVQNGKISLEQGAVAYAAWTDAQARANGQSTDAVDDATKLDNAYTIVSGAVTRMGDETKTATDKAIQATQHWAGQTKADLQTFRDAFTSSMESTFGSLGVTVKDTFNVTQKELNKAFRQMLIASVRFNRDIKALMALKPGTLGLSKTDTQKFQMWMTQQAPGYIDRFVQGTDAQQRRLVKMWEQHVNELNQASRRVKDVTMHADTSELTSLERGLADLTAKTYQVIIDVHTRPRSPWPDEALEQHLFAPLRRNGAKMVGGKWTLPLDVAAHTDQQTKFGAVKASGWADWAGKNIPNMPAGNTDISVNHHPNRKVTVKLDRRHFDEQMAYEEAYRGF